MTLGVTTFTSIIPFPTVFATAVPTVKAAAKLKNAAQTTAAIGLSTRVPTIVAIELAESWNPLMKSKTSATMTIATTYETTAQECLIAMLSNTIPTVWHWSIARSSVSNSSFHFMISIGSRGPLKSPPTAW